MTPGIAARARRRGIEGVREFSGSSSPGRVRPVIAERALLSCPPALDCVQSHLKGRPPLLQHATSSQGYHRQLHRAAPPRQIPPSLMSLIQGSHSEHHVAEYTSPPSAGNLAGVESTHPACARVHPYSYDLLGRRFLGAPAYLPLRVGLLTNLDLSSWATRFSSRICKTFRASRSRFSSCCMLPSSMEANPFTDGHRSNGDLDRAGDNSNFTFDCDSDVKHAA